MASEREQEYFEPSSNTWADIKANTIAREIENYSMDDLIRPLLAKKKYFIAKRWKEALSPQQRRPKTKDHYTETQVTNVNLAIKGGYLNEAKEGIVADFKTLC